METISELYMRAKSRTGSQSDYAFGNRFGVSRQVISRWKNGIDTISDRHALLLADALGCDPGYVMACAAAERAETPEIRAVWEGLAALALRVSQANSGDDGPGSGSGTGENGGDQSTEKSGNTPSFSDNSQRIGIMSNKADTYTPPSWMLAGLFKKH